MAKVPDNIPPRLGTLSSDKEGPMSEKLKNHTKFNNKQRLVVFGKEMSWKASSLLRLLATMCSENW